MRLLADFLAEKRHPSAFPRKIGTGLCLFSSLLFYNVNVMAQGMTLQLAPSIYSGGFNISCFGGANGSINLSVSGGTTPFTYRWSNDATTEDISSLPAGYYGVTVVDINHNIAYGQITLTEPREMVLDILVVEYPNGYNISCYECYNGMIYVDVIYGVPPYSFEWSDGWLEQDHLGLGSGNYSVMVTDQNGCRFGSDQFYITRPARNDWTVQGNNDTESNHFIGTGNSRPLIMKTDSEERLRITEDGSLMVSSFATADTGLLMADANGLLFKANIDDALLNETTWLTTGNSFSNAPKQRFIGTRTAQDLVFYTDNSEKMRLKTSGRLGIGTTTPLEKLHIDHHDPTGGILLNQLSTTTGQGFRSQITFSIQGQEQWALGNNFSNTNQHSFFLWDQQQEVNAIFINGTKKKIYLYEPEIETSTSDYVLYVGGGIAAREVKVMLGTFPDFVFDSSYQLLPLFEVERFIQANRHLPGIPSISEVEAQKGVELGSLQLKLLQKIEELTLYMIQQQKEIERLEQTLDSFQHDER